MQSNKSVRMRYLYGYTKKLRKNNHYDWKPTTSKNPNAPNLSGAIFGQANAAYSGYHWNRAIRWIPLLPSTRKYLDKLPDREDKRRFLFHSNPFGYAQRITWKSGSSLARGCTAAPLEAFQKLPEGITLSHRYGANTGLRTGNDIARVMLPNLWFAESYGVAVSGCWNICRWYSKSRKNHDVRQPVRDICSTSHSKACRRP